MEEKKVITIGMCLEESPEQKIIYSSSLLGTIIQRCKRKYVITTVLKQNFIVPECFKKEYIQVYLSWLLKRCLQKINNLNDNKEIYNSKTKNDMMIHYFMNELANDLKIFGFKYTDDTNNISKEAYFYTNAKTKGNKKYIKNFNSWYLPNLKINETKNI